MSVINYIWSDTYTSFIYVIPPQNRNSDITIYITVAGGPSNNVFKTIFSYSTIEDTVNNNTITYTQLSCTGDNINMRYTIGLPNTT